VAGDFVGSGESFGIGSDMQASSWQGHGWRFQVEIKTARKTASSLL
jgi:hypothetical protein